MRHVAGNTYDNNLPYLWAVFKQLFYQQHPVEIIFSKALELFANQWLKEEFYLQVGAAKYQRSPNRKAYSCGYYRRKLISSKGSIILNVPRARNMSIEYCLFEKYKRYTPEIEQIIAQSILLGHSTRKARAFFKKILGDDAISQQLATNILRKYDFELERWKNRKIDRKVKILVVDAMYLKGAIWGIKSAKPVLFAYGVYEDGTGEILDFEPARSESSNNWLIFLGRLYHRGLSNVELIVSDDSASISDAIAMLWPTSKHQLCLFHFLRNFDKKTYDLDKKLRRNLKTDLQEVFKAEDIGAFQQRLSIFLRKYRFLQQHKAIKYLLEHLEQLTQFYSMPKHMQAIAKTTNRLERIFKEIKRRVKAFGRFPNSNSCRRWLFALIVEELIPKFREVSHA